MSPLNLMFFIFLCLTWEVNWKPYGIYFEELLDSNNSTLFKENNCEVTEKETNLKKLCEGTFIYKGKTYYGCTIWESSFEKRCKFKVSLK